MGIHEFGAKHRTKESSDLLRIVGARVAFSLAIEIADRRAIEVKRGNDDVGGGVAGNLDDVLGAVRFNGVDPVLVKESIEADFLGHHALRFDAGGGPDVLEDIEDGFERVFAGGSEVHVGPVLLRIRCERLDVVVEIGEDMVANLGCMGAEVFPVVHFDYKGVTLRGDDVLGSLDGAMLERVGEGSMDALLERGVVVDDR